jgi:hypothetical protein
MKTSSKQQIPLRLEGLGEALKEAIATRDRLLTQINTRSGLFGDTAAPSASLFPDDTFNTNEARRQISVLNQRIESLRQQITAANKAAATAAIENAGQILIF